MRPLETVRSNDSLRGRTIERVNATVELTNLTIDLDHMRKRYSGLLMSLENDMDIGNQALLIRKCIEVTYEDAAKIRDTVNTKTNGLLSELLNA